MGSSAPYQFIGLDGIQNLSPLYGGSAFTSSNLLSCIGSLCTSSCISSTTCTSQNGVVSGSLCILCGPNQRYLNNQCYSNTVNCLSNQYYNGSACVCVSNYVNISNTCYPSCGPNAYINLSNRCVCLPNYAYSGSTGICTLQPTIICGANSYPSNGLCVCQPGFGLINNLCLQCPANSYISATGYCVCISGYTLNTNQLLCLLNTVCFPNSTPNA